jgi:hypothetical protein
MQDELHQRKTIIAALYLQRRSHPGQPGLTLPDLEQLLGVPKDQLVFSLWYLTEGDFVKRGDNGSHSILLKGVDLAETIIGLRAPASAAEPAAATSAGLKARSS